MTLNSRNVEGNAIVTRSFEQDGSHIVEHRERTFCTPAVLWWRSGSRRVARRARGGHGSYTRANGSGGDNGSHGGTSRVTRARVGDPRRVRASGVWGIHGGDGIAVSVITSALIYSQHATLEKGSTRSLQPNELSILVSVYEGQTTSGAF